MSTKNKNKFVPLSELSFSNDFMFAEVMRDPEVCKLFLEELLGKQISRVDFIDKQEDLSDVTDVHGIRLDVYLDDKKQTRCGVEIQNKNYENLECLARYYKGGIDRRSLAKNAGYKKLRDSYVIFVCDFDYFGAGFACYQQKYFCYANDVCIEPWNDGSHEFFLNARYQKCKANAPEPILRFLDYVRTGVEVSDPDSVLMQKVQSAVIRTRNNKSLEAAYMTYMMKIQEVLEEGRE